MRMEDIIMTPEEINEYISNMPYKEKEIYEKISVAIAVTRFDPEIISEHIALMVIKYIGDNYHLEKMNND